MTPNALPTPQLQVESIQRLLAEKNAELDALRAELADSEKARRESDRIINRQFAELEAIEAQRDFLAGALRKCGCLECLQSREALLSQPGIAEALAADQELREAIAALDRNNGASIMAVFTAAQRKWSKP